MNEEKETRMKDLLEEVHSINSEVDWNVLDKIYEHYTQLRKSLLPTAKFIAEELGNISYVHTVKYRIKEPEHLIRKIIRKQKSHPDLKIDVTNYQKIITDLIGVRAIHLFKQDWIHIHDYIKSNWELEQPPKAYVGCTVDENLVAQYRKYGIRVN